MTPGRTIRRAAALVLACCYLFSAVPPLYGQDASSDESLLEPTPLPTQPVPTPIPPGDTPTPSTVAIAVQDTATTPSPRPGIRNSTIILAFIRPFVGAPVVNNYFDHDLPQEFVDANGYQLTFWGDRVYPDVDGHNGYDFGLQEGTPIFAVANGVVVSTGPGNPFDCPLLNNQTVLNPHVVVEHRFRALGANGDDLVLRTTYLHIGRSDVHVGQEVRQGDQLGVSGNTGCSTGPHLHFEVDVLKGDRFVPIDPYGWEGPGPDPWAQHPDGAPSIWLWQDGQAPPLYRESARSPNPNSTDRFPVTITKVRWESWGDSSDQNHNYIEVTLDPRFAPTGRQDMTGYTLRLNSGATYRFPDGFTILYGRTVTVYLGRGANTATALFWGGVRPNPMGDCPTLLLPNGSPYKFGLGPTPICSPTSG